MSNKYNFIKDVKDIMDSAVVLKQDRMLYDPISGRIISNSGKTVKVKG